MEAVHAVHEVVHESIRRDVVLFVQRHRLFRHLAPRHAANKIKSNWLCFLLNTTTLNVNKCYKNLVEK